MLTVIPAEARAFCESTTVRGISRILKAKSRLMFVVWLVAVLTCAGLLAWQLSFILARYTSYPVNTKLVEYTGEQNLSFPDITVCNSFPLVHESEMSMSYNDFLKVMIDAFFVKNISQTFPDISPQTLNEILLYMTNQMAFYNNFPIVTETQDNENQSLILNCSYFSWYFDSAAQDCWSHVRTVWDPDYYRCHTLRLRETERSKVRGFSAVLYIEDFLQTLFTRFDLSPKDTKATGARILIHPPGTKPDMKLGIDISPGMETTIDLKQTLRTRLGVPYSNCTTQDYISSGDLNYTYDKDFCAERCLQQQIVEVCDCIWNEIRFTEDQLREANFIVCGNVSLTSANSLLSSSGMFSLKCAIEFKPDRLKCEEKCLVSCYEKYYDQTVSSAPWPHISTHLTFYLTYLSGNLRFGDKFDAHEIALDAARNLYLLENNDTLRKMLVALDRDGLIRNNFLQVNVMFKNPSFNELRDEPEFPIDAMGASVGGTLSLWLGVTVMFVFETFEFVHAVLNAWLNARQKPVEIVS